MEGIFRLILLVILLSVTVFCQAKDSATINKLHSFNLYPYPNTEELKTCMFDNSLIQAQPIFEQDINDSFSNTDDLDWLKEIAQNNKVILLGEEHYHKYILNIRNRILFYLNTVDYYPLIVLEAKYSNTGFFNYYINLEDNKAADTFFKNVLCKMFYSEDNYNLLRNIRKWNKINPSRKISVGCSDIEHDYGSTLKYVLLPYFKKMDKDLNIDIWNLSLPELGKLLPKLLGLLKKAEEANIPGDYPFLTPQYISNVISNLEASYNDKVFETDYYRQRAIVRNLTDEKYLGKYFTSGKVLLHGGARHMTTHFSYPEDGNFFREGSYLNEDFLPTKGKVYSIYLHSFYRSLGKTAEYNLDTCHSPGDFYNNVLLSLQRAYKEKLITCNDFLTGSEISDFHKLFLKIQAEYNNKPIVVNSIDWKSALEVARKTKNRGLFDIISGWENDHIRYDRHIFIPGSPLVELMKKTF